MSINPIRYSFPEDPSHTPSKELVSKLSSFPREVQTFVLGSCSQRKFQKICALFFKRTNSIPNNLAVTAESSPTETIAALKNRRSRIRYTGLDTLQLRIILAVCRQIRIERLIDKIEPWRLVDLMNYMSLTQKQFAISRLAQGRMGMVIPRLDKNILRSCASHIATLMTLEQLETLLTDQYAILVPQLDELQIAQIVDLPNSDDPNSNWSASRLGVALRHETKRKFVIDILPDLNDSQLERCISVIQLSDLNEIYSELGARKQQQIQALLKYNEEYQLALNHYPLAD